MSFEADVGNIANPDLIVPRDIKILKSIAESVERLRSAYPVSGEINQETYALGNHPCIEMPVDSLSVRFHTGFRPLAANGYRHGNWRFNLRESNTAPLLQLNVESIGSEGLLIEQTMKVSEKLHRLGSNRETKFRWEGNVLLKERSRRKKRHLRP